jgi:hypothetical protein
MRQKWFDVVAAISLAACEHGACMFIPAPQPVGCTAQPTGCEHETGLQFRTKSVKGLDCFMGAMSRDEANLGKESACLERQA